MIITSSEVKMYIHETSTTYDVLINALIEPCLFDVFDYTNNYFENNAVRIDDALMTFSTTGTVIINGSNFSTYSFQNGDEIRIIDSKRNDGIYTAVTISSATITISTLNTFKSENQECGVDIVKVDVPKSLKPILSMMIKHRIDNYTGTPKSESLGDYSVTYGDGDYPETIMKSLNKYRLVKFI
jgi:hypothetical protein